MERPGINWNVTFVGQAPNSSDDSENPLCGECGRKLAKLLGFSENEYTKFRRVNLNKRFPGKAGKGDGFNFSEGRQTAGSVELNGRNFVLLGEKVAECFGFQFDKLAVKERGANRFLIFPHPSGVNTFWNEAENRAAAAVALRKFVAAETEPAVFQRSRVEITPDGRLNLVREKADGGLELWAVCGEKTCGSRRMLACGFSAAEMKEVRVQEALNKIGWSDGRCPLHA